MSPITHRQQRGIEALTDQEWDLLSSALERQRAELETLSQIPEMKSDLPEYLGVLVSIQEKIMQLAPSVQLHETG